MNGHFTIAFVDSGADETVLRLSFALEIKVEINYHGRPIVGYGYQQGGYTIGTARIRLKLGKFETEYLV